MVFAVAPFDNFFDNKIVAKYIHDYLFVLFILYWCLVLRADCYFIGQCKVGMELSYSFGGKVYLDDTDISVSQRSYILVAGGVGINPIYSILQTALPKTDYPVTLLYSAQNREELMFSVS